MIVLHLAHPPLSKPRPRATIGGRVFMPDRYRAWQSAVALDARSQYRGEPIKGPIHISLIVAGPSRGRGDLEGIFGALADTLGGNRHANAPGIVFDDDDQIVSLEAMFTEAPDWLLSVAIHEVEAPDWEGAKKRRQQVEREAKKAARKAAKHADKL